MPPDAYPRTRTSDATDIHFGVPIADPYRWLENDGRSDAEVADWIAQQNAVTEAHLAELPGRALFRRRMKALLDYERVSVPRKHGTRYFMLRNDGLAEQNSIVMRESLDGPDRVLIDPNSWADDRADAIGEWAVSDDGRLLAYTVQVGGTDWRTIRVLDIDAGRDRDDTVEWARFTRIAWAPDGSGFFYSRMPAPEGGAQAVAPIADHAIHFHRLGTPQSQDRLIHAGPKGQTLIHSADRPVGSRYLAINSTPGTNESALSIVDLHSDDWTSRTVIAGMDAEWTVIGNNGEKLVVITTDAAERRRVVSLDLAEEDPKPVEIVPEAEGTAVLNDAALLGGKLVIAYMVDVKTEIRRFDASGAPDGIVALPGIGTAAVLHGRADDDEAFFIFTSYDTPTTVYRYDVSANTIAPFARPKTEIDLDRIVVEQRFYPSKDGTRVPLFLVRRSDVTSAPTILYAYGGFGISQIPSYDPIWLSWVEQGGILAVANIRGGGEYGRAWHRAGQRENRQTAFDDFIAAGDYLKAEGITPAKGLAIHGGSNGGLLVGAVTNQRPDLFDAALPSVGVLDMLRYDRFTGGVLWVDEFGSPADEAHFRNLMTYSPLHTIRDGAAYPAILATTADADDRVIPAHSFKYIAALQAADLGDKPRLVRVETRAGHGAGMPLDKVVAQFADMWAFAAHWTGLNLETTE